eukprot:CAMPEP_0197621894 /NCGR_PEP_ID=MMETSP1338-20131121/2323_1 /TAXON_ID=43686 ORGANISM="Pelagodinium beii, Strain RCC1491" /NCGR_SAMPLE_ID=MMETSP1338 /ASSEMBLY_ACC=CAM_ASM_000754 /LENGTH=643 /DNA_ID=CAMNT_0043191467 /DNA_START=16 /DNA_END=1947 /DNA_ORIENTATION=-
MSTTGAFHCMLKALLLGLIASPALGQAQVELGGGSNGWDQQGWYVQVDGVMGGKSTGDLAFSDSNLIFSGTINLQGGGFSSVRRSLAGNNDLSNHAGILIELESEILSSVQAPLGLHLQLGDSKSTYGYSAAFAVPFSSPERELSRIFIPMDGFDRADRMGFVCSSCRLDTSSVNEVDVYVLFQEGAFEVRLRSITAIAEKPSFEFLASTPEVSMTSTDVSGLITKTIASGGSLWDKGYPELCIAIYETTARQILASTGSSLALRSLACVGLREASIAASKNDKGWILRKAFDAVLADLSGQARTADSGYPSAVQGAWLPAPGESSDCSSLNESVGTAADLSVDESIGSSFEGPFEGKGISGYNDLGQYFVDNPSECAEKCRQLSQCRSFDYGAREKVSGECWLSTANRASAGAAYTTWTLYDYYERSSDPSDSNSDIISPTSSETEDMTFKVDEASFEGPFEGMGISGYNDLGLFRVDAPGECAEKCLAMTACKSFDYGAREQVLGECWLSTANRESAGSAYSSWPLYDYYEQSNSGGIGNGKRSNDDMMNSGVTEPGQSDEDGTFPVMVAVVCTGVVGCLVGLGTMFLYNKYEKKKKSVAFQVEGPVAGVAEGSPVDAAGSNPTVVVVGQPVQKMQKDGKE